MSVLYYRHPDTGQWTELDVGEVDHGALTGRTDDDHTQYINTTRGDDRYLKLSTGTGVDNAITGQLEVREPALLRIGTDDVNHIRLRSGNKNGYALRVENPSGGLGTVYVGSAITSEPTFAVSQYQSKLMVAPKVMNVLHSSIGWQAVTSTDENNPNRLTGGFRTLTARSEPGLWRLQTLAYARVLWATATANIWYGIGARWADGTPVTWANGNLTRNDRWVVPVGMYGAYYVCHAEAWVQNTGQALTYGGQAYQSGGATSWEFGFYIANSATFWPYGGVKSLPLDIGWHSW